MTLQQRLLEIANALGGPILALDASTKIASLCTVGLQPNRVQEFFLDASVLPSEALVQAIADEFAATQSQASHLRAMVVGLGPGSFTGLRVALATVKGLAFGANVPVYGVSSLALIAASHGPGRIAPILDARRGDVFSALYEVADNGDIICLLEDTTQSRLVFDTALAAYSNVTCIDESTIKVRAAFGIIAARHRLFAQQADDLTALVPRYLRLSEAERSANSVAQPAPYRLP